MALPSSDEQLRGIDRASLERWYAGHVPGSVPPLSFAPVAGGRSNLTFVVTDAAGRRSVLRRPPLGHVLESAHDVVREHRILSALAPTPVPVPQPLGVCEDPEVTGAPFYVMDFIEGTVLRAPADVESRFAPAERERIADALIDTLAALHALDPQEVGLGDLVRRTGLAERQLRRWYAQYQQSRAEALPAIDEVHRRLHAHIPEASRTSIVHGDFRLDNTLIASDGSVAAVLDWELCTAGDPLADLGLLLVYWSRPRDGASHAVTDAPTTVDGFPERDELTERYAARTGIDVAPLRFYVALGFWKLACIADGVRARYAAGVMDADDTAAERFARQVPLLAEAALTASEPFA